jgi:DNA-binding XRE family transcriptional regulator
MIRLTNVQTIMQGGKPVFVVIPYDDYIRAFPAERNRIPDGDRIPHEVVGLTVSGEYSLARAWREYLNLTQEEVATRMGITQPALVQIENAKRPRRPTLQKLAHALGISVEQLL